MADELTEEITHLLNQLYSTEIDGTIRGPSAQAQQETPRALLAIAKQSAENRDAVIRALITALEEDADGGADERFSTVCDVLGKLNAVESIDTLVKYIDYQPNRIGTSLHYKPSVKALIQIGEPAIPKLEETLEFGKSVLDTSNSRLRHNAVTALIYIGGTKCRDALERAYTLENEEPGKEWLEFAIREIDVAEAERKTEVSSDDCGVAIAKRIKRS